MKTFDIEKFLWRRYDTRFTFDNFVVGASNRSAYAAAIRVAESFDKSCNPLIICGCSGLGKTHLIQAIANRFMQNNNQARVCHIDATDYVSGVRRAFQTNSIEEFRQFYKSLDLLLFESIQYLLFKPILYLGFEFEWNQDIEEAPKFKQELINTIRFLIDNNKQVVVSNCTLTPEIPEVFLPHTELFSSCVTTAIYPPDLELKVDILLQKAGESGTTIGKDVALYIARLAPSNLRELEGMLKRLKAWSQYHKRSIDVGSTIEALKDVFEIYSASRHR